MTARAQRVVDALLRAKGSPLTAGELAERARVDKVPTAIAEARQELGAPIETVRPRGTGYRLAPDWSPDNAAPPLEPTALKPLSDRAARLLARLEKAGGAWVPGKTLADPMGLYPSDLVPIVRSIRLKRPHLVIEGEHGRGYRLAPAGEAPPLPPEPKPAVQPVPKPKPLAKHLSHRTVLDLLAALAPATAERVRDIALEANQTPGAAIERLLEYGIEVHRDLVVHGEHPLALGRAA